MWNPHRNRPPSALRIARCRHFESARAGQLDHFSRLAQRLLSNVFDARFRDDFRSLPRRIKRRNRRRAEGEAKGVVAETHRRRLEIERNGASPPGAETPLALWPRPWRDTEKRSAR